MTIMTSETTVKYTSPYRRRTYQFHVVTIIQRLQYIVHDVVKLQLDLGRRSTSASGGVIF